MPHLLRLLHETGGRRAVKIAHHIPGRLRLRATWELQRLFDGKDKEALLHSLTTTHGVEDVRVNAVSASLVVQYDPQRISFQAWEDLFKGDDAQAEAVLAWLLPKPT